MFFSDVKRFINNNITRQDMKLITDPNRFFEGLKEKEIKIRKPMVIVTALAILVSAYQYFLMTKLSQAFPAEIAKFFMIGAYIGNNRIFHWHFCSLANTCCDNARDISFLRR